MPRNCVDLEIYVGCVGKKVAKTLPRFTLLLHTLNAPTSRKFSPVMKTIGETASSHDREAKLQVTLENQMMIQREKKNRTRAKISKVRQKRYSTIE
jgi:hypothetical protein